jgi:hypothetical protein
MILTPSESSLAVPKSADARTVECILMMYPKELLLKQWILQKRPLLCFRGLAQLSPTMEWYVDANNFSGT